MSITPFNSIDTKKLLFGQLEKKKGLYFCPVYYKSPENHLITKTPPMTTYSGLEPKRNRYSIDVDLEENRLKRHRDLYNVLTAIDDMCIDCTYERSKEWFRKQIPKRAIQARYQSPMIPGWADEPAKMRLEFLIEDPKDVVDKKHRYLDPKHVVSGSKVICVMQLLGFWVSNNFLGAHWRIIKLIANVENPEADALALEAEKEEQQKREEREQERERERKREREKERERKREKERDTKPKSSRGRSNRDDEDRPKRRRGKAAPKETSNEMVETKEDRPSTRSTKSRRAAPQKKEVEKSSRSSQKSRKDTRASQKKSTTRTRTKREKTPEPQPSEESEEPEKELAKETHQDSFEDDGEVITEDDDVRDEERDDSEDDSRRRDHPKEARSEDEKDSYDDYNSDSYYSGSE